MRVIPSIIAAGTLGLFEGRFTPAAVICINCAASFLAADMSVFFAVVAFAIKKTKLRHF
jgi:hypothetical protein